MEKRLTRGEKWLFASPILFLVIAGAAWQWRKAAPFTMEIPDATAVRSMEFSPDGKRLVACFDEAKTRRHFGQVYDLESRSKLCDLESAYPAWQSENSEAPFWSNDGKLVATNAQIGSRITNKAASQVYNQISVWDAVSGALKWKHRHQQSENVALWEEENHVLLNKVRFSENDKIFIGAGVPPAVYDVITGKRLNSFDKRVKQDANFTRLSPNAQWLATRIVDKQRNASLEVVDTKTQQQLWKPAVEYIEKLEWHGDVLSVAYTKYADKPMTFKRSGLLLWDASTHRSLPEPPFIKYLQPIELSFIPQQTAIAYGYYNGEEVEYKSDVVVWDYRANRVRWQQKIEGQLLKIQPSPDGKWLAAVSAAGGFFKLSVFDQSGRVQFECQPANYVVSWSSDDQLAFQATKGKPSGGYTNFLEIQRFEN